MEEENLQNQFTCIICCNTLRCPVKLKIFETTDEHKCWEHNRLCLRCARKYLKMDDKKRDKHLEMKRCPFCNSEETNKRIKFLHSKITYEKDKQLFTTITKLIKEGKLSKMNCECGEEFDDEYLMENHFKYNCPESHINCHQCRKKMKRSELQNHLDTDCIKCTRCNKFMPSKWCTEHILFECK